MGAAGVGDARRERDAGWARGMLDGGGWEALPWSPPRARGTVPRAGRCRRVRPGTPLRVRGGCQREVLTNGTERWIVRARCIHLEVQMVWFAPLN